MKATLLACLAFAIYVASSHAGQTVISEISLQNLVDAGALKSGKVRSAADGTTILEIVSDKGGPLQAALFTIDTPPVTTHFHAITGEVRYENVNGSGYLEMWNHFGEGAYFSRTLADMGPMAKLTGNSGWRRFVVPFDSTGAAAKLSKLDVNLNIPSDGTVCLRDLKLIEATQFAELMSPPPLPHNGDTASPPDSGQPRPSVHFTRTVGWITAIAACFSYFAYLLALRGCATKFILTGMKLMTVAALVVLFSGGVALLLHGPTRFWESLFISGSILSFIFVLQLLRYRRCSRELELRKMASMDTTAT